MNKLKYTIYIFLYVLLILASGLMNIVIFEELDWSLILNLKFWLEIVIDYSVYISFFVITMMFSYDRLAITDDDYVELENAIFGMKDILSGDAFEKHIMNKNYIEKKRTWLETLRTYIGNHNRKKTDKINVEMLTYPKDKWSKDTIKYIKKQERLNLFVQDDFIKTEMFYKKYYNVSTGTKFKKVHYPEITKNEIIYGSVTASTKKSVLVRGTLRKQFGLKIVMTMPSIVLKVVYEIFVIDSFRSTAELFKELSFLIIMCLFHALAGISASKKAHMDRKSNTTIRYGIATDYRDGMRYETAPMYDLVKKVEKEQQESKQTIMLATNPPQYRTMQNESVEIIDEST